MATHSHDLGRASALPLDALLASIPSLPRPLLARLTARLIEHMDELDGDPDLEDGEGQARVDERGRYLFDRKHRGRGKRKGKIYAGITEDDEDGGDRELEGSEDDLLGLVPISADPHPDLPRIIRELRARRRRC